MNVFALALMTTAVFSGGADERPGLEEPAPLSGPELGVKLPYRFNGKRMCGRQMSVNSALE